MSKKQKMCRICFENGKNLISPCHCSGTIKFVHRECLEKWRNFESDIYRPFRCEICHSFYQFDDVPDLGLCRYLRKIFYIIYIYLEIIFHFYCYYQKTYSEMIPVCLLVPIGMILHKKYSLLLMILCTVCIIVVIFEKKPENTVVMGILATITSIVFFIVSEMQIRKLDTYVVRDLSK